MTRQISILVKRITLLPGDAYVYYSNDDKVGIKPVMIKLLVVGILVKHQCSYAGRLSTGIDQESRAACISKEIHTADDGQLTNHVVPVVHKSPRSSTDDPCVSKLRRRQ